MNSRRSPREQHRNCLYLKVNSIKPLFFERGAGSLSVNAISKKTIFCIGAVRVGEPRLVPRPFSAFEFQSSERVIEKTICLTQFC